MTESAACVAWLQVTSGHHVDMHQSSKTCCTTLATTPTSELNRFFILKMIRISFSLSVLRFQHIITLHLQTSRWRSHQSAAPVAALIIPALVLATGSAWQLMHTQAILPWSHHKPSASHPRVACQKVKTIHRKRIRGCCPGNNAHYAPSEILSAPD